MKINEKYHITSKNNTDEIVTNLMNADETKTYVPGDKEYDILQTILSAMRRKTVSPVTRNRCLTKRLQDLGFTNEADIAERLVEDAATQEQMAEEARRNFEIYVEKFLKFFSEFNFTVSYRFLDTFLRADNKPEYVTNYFTLCGHPWATEVANKVKSAEFKDLCAHLTYKPEKVVNSRIKVYYGPAGTGKTTVACGEADTCIVCAADMQCTDILKDFCFKDGKPSFEKSAVWLAIEQGKKVVFDEINLLSKQVLQFLQGLTDGKPYVDFEGTRINIHPDFQIIGTMNLIVNGMNFPLPEPIVDRCSEIKEFKLTAKDLVKALL